MKKLVSFVLGAVVLFGAATFGMQSATANAKDHHDKNYWRHHRRHHRHHSASQEPLELLTVHDICKSSKRNSIRGSGDTAQAQARMCCLKDRNPISRRLALMDFSLTRLAAGSL